MRTEGDRSKKESPAMFFLLSCPAVIVDGDWSVEVLKGGSKKVRTEQARVDRDEDWIIPAEK